MHVTFGWRIGAVGLLVLGVIAGCGSGDDDTEGVAASAPTTTAAPAPTTTIDLLSQIESDFAGLHLGLLEEFPGLRAVFYHDPAGWATEDLSTDEGATWCHHAWYEWAVTEATAPDQFTVTYTPTVEDCAPGNQPLVLHVTGREVRNGQTVFTGEYEAPAGSTVERTVERTVCTEAIEDWPSVCAIELPLDAPAEAPRA